MDAPPAVAKKPEGQRKRARDEELLAVVLRVVLHEGTISSQRRLAQLVNGKLRRRGQSVTGARVRGIAVRSGLVGVDIRVRHDGETPEMTQCPVCAAKLKRTGNRTLTGGTAKTGYKCPRCPWWTGRQLRIPQHYTFYSKVARAEGEEEGQLSFVVGRDGQRRL